MQDGKWIPELRPHLPVVQAARQVLQVRLRAVSERLASAMQTPEEDVEHVHQLRVSTRRAGAALRIFYDWLPEKTAKKMKKTLRRLRRSAGAARDWDVFLASLENRIGKGGVEQRPGIDVLVGIAHGQRWAAQTGLVQAVGELPRTLEPLIAATLSDLQTPRGQKTNATLRDLAMPLLAQLLHELEAAAAGDLHDYAHLHQVRILGKQLRYAMEVFACCFGPEFREAYYAAVEEMQEILGLANDSHVAAHRLTDLGQQLAKGHPRQWRRYQPGIESLLKYHQARLPRQRRLFLKWWKQWRESGGEQGLARMVEGAPKGGGE